MRVLFISAHIDDCEVCCGGTMAKFGGDYIAFSSCGLDTSEFFKAGVILKVNGRIGRYDVRRLSEKANEIADYVYEWIREYNYDLIITHSIHDRHPDHRTVAEQVGRVTNGNLLTFIAPWNGNEDPNYFVEITEEQLNKKIEALKCYKSQFHRHYMNEDFIRSWARYNGGKIGKLYAEGFKLVRGIDFAEVCNVNRECERMNVAERLKP